MLLRKYLCLVQLEHGQHAADQCNLRGQSNLAASNQLQAEYALERCQGAGGDALSCGPLDDAPRPRPLCSSSWLSSASSCLSVPAHDAGGHVWWGVLRR